MELTGVVTKVSNGKTKTGKDNYYLWFGESKFSGFGKAPCNEGDTITFDYIVNGQYNNIKEIINVISTGVVKDQPKAAGEMIGESAKTKRKAEMMRCAVDVCLKKDSFTDGDILAQFKWFMEQIGEPIEPIDMKGGKNESNI